MNRRYLFFKVMIIITVTLAMIFIPELYLLAQEATKTGKDIVESAVLNGTNKTFMAMTAMGAVGISCITSAYALAKIGTAAMGAMSEKPEIGGRALVFLGMAEGIAIYGLIVAIMILNKI